MNPINIIYTLHLIMDFMYSMKNLCTEFFLMQNSWVRRKRLASYSYFIGLERSRVMCKLL
jgi:hypothetical protein